MALDDANRVREGYKVLESIKHIVNTTILSAQFVELRSSLFKHMAEKIMGLEGIDEAIHLLRLSPKHFEEVTPRRLIKLIRMAFIVLHGEETFIMSSNNHKGFRPEKTLLRISSADALAGEPYLPYLTLDRVPLPKAVKMGKLTDEEKEARKIAREEAKKENPPPKIKAFEDAPFIFRKSADKPKSSTSSTQDSEEESIGNEPITKEGDHS